MSISSLPTPIPLVDLDRMSANIARVSSYAGEHGLALRPHVKTHKALRPAREQLAAGAAGFTCATPREAEVMSGLSGDLMLAYPPIGAVRAGRVAELAARTGLRVMLDSREAADQLAEALRGSSASIDILVELDLGMRRVGVGTAEQAVGLARHVEKTPGLRWIGLGFYPGHIREPPDRQDEAIRDLDRRLGEFLAAFDATGMKPRVVSGGSTPTLWNSHRIGGLTEIRPGTSIYNDRTTAAIGACGWNDCALTVLATVVSTAVAGQAVIDAGTKSLGREPIRGTESPGFGVLIDRPEVIVSAMSEEHGTLDLSGTDWRPKVGDQVRIIPNHVCIVTHLFDEVVGIRGDRVVERWTVDARGR